MTPNQSPAKLSRPNQAESRKPTFEFYTLLTKEQLALDTEPNKNINRPTPLVPSLSKTAMYTVQVASFKKKQDAERMQASLILQGFNVTVTRVKQNQIFWYRVNVGPFDSRRKAEIAQVAVARAERVAGMIRKVDA